MKRLAVLLAGVLSAASATTHFKETFDDSYSSRWVTSNWKKSSGDAGTFVHTAGKWYGDAKDGKGLSTSQDARFYAASAKFSPFSNAGKPLVIQFEVKFPQNIDCGGGYIKVGSNNIDQANWGGDAPYHIMFGPDICGQTKKVHVIFNYPKKNNENLLIKKEIRAESDQLTHAYTLIVNPDQTYEVRVDGARKEGGKLLEDWDFLPAKTIKDPSISKPADWVDDEKIDDPTDHKPTDWDSTPRQIPDPEAEKPEDWDDDADGEWEAPQIDNPEWKGEWKPKRIPNPAYKGPWVHPEIPNPEYKEDSSIGTYADIGSVGVDVWQVKSGTIWDNIIITDSIKEAEDFLAEHYGKHKDAEKAMFDDAEKAKREAEEADRKKQEAERAAKEAEEEEEEDEDEGHDEL